MDLGGGDNATSVDARLIAGCSFLFAVLRTWKNLEPGCDLIFKTILPCEH